jgi:hypothetical protein
MASGWSLQRIHVVPHHVPPASHNQNKRCKVPNIMPSSSIAALSSALTIQSSQNAPAIRRRHIWEPLRFTGRQDVSAYHMHSDLRFRRSRVTGYNSAPLWQQDLPQCLLREPASATAHSGSSMPTSRPAIWHRVLPQAVSHRRLLSSSGAVQKLHPLYRLARQPPVSVRQPFLTL